MKEQFNLIATAAAGLEAVVGREVRDLGYDCQVENGRVRFQGDVKAIIETNLWLRAADRIKIVVGSFPAKTFEELFQGVFALDWENYLPLGARFPISKAKCVKSKLHNEPSVQAISKKAVVKKLQKHYARPEGVPLMETGPEFKIEVSILKDVATVMIDTTGSSLFKRGYRTEKGGAPIKENMAAAILQLSNWYPDKPLIDPSRFKDISIKEMHTIDVIGKFPEATPSKVSKELMVTLGTVTTSLNNLERKGYIERIRSDQDRRVVYLHLTKKGRLVHRLHKRFHKAMVEKIIDGMSPEEKEVMGRGLTNLYQFLEDLK